jgi:hypothetical protein
MSLLQLTDALSISKASRFVFTKFSELDTSSYIDTCKYKYDNTNHHATVCVGTDKNKYVFRCYRHYEEEDDTKDRDTYEYRIHTCDKFITKWQIKHTDELGKESDDVDFMAFGYASRRTSCEKLYGYIYVDSDNILTFGKHKFAIKTVELFVLIDDIDSKPLNTSSVKTESDYHRLISRPHQKHIDARKQEYDAKRLTKTLKPTRFINIMNPKRSYYFVSDQKVFKIMTRDCKVLVHEKDHIHVTGKAYVTKLFDYAYEVLCDVDLEYIRDDTEKCDVRLKLNVKRDLFDIAELEFCNIYE